MRPHWPSVALGAIAAAVLAGVVLAATFGWSAYERCEELAAGGDAELRECRADRDAAAARASESRAQCIPADRVWEMLNYRSWQ